MFGCACEEGEEPDEQVSEAECCMQHSENPQQQQQTHTHHFAPLWRGNSQAGGPKLQKTPLGGLP